MGGSRADSGRIRGHIRSNVVGYVAVFLALSGTAAALPGSNTVFSDDITNGEVRTADLRNAAVTIGKLAPNSVNQSRIAANSVRTSEIRNNQVRSADVRDDSLANGGLTAADLQTSSVRQPEIATDGVAATEIQNNSIDSGEVIDNGIGGADIAESTLSVRAMGCQTGSILGFARVKGSASMPSDWTSNPAWIDRVYNCAGGPVSVRAGIEGLYWVRFEGNPATLPIVTLDPADQDNFVSAKLADFPCAGSMAITGTYCVFVRDNDGDSQHGSFAILLP